MNSLVICMDRRPDGRKPVEIRCITGGGRVLFSRTDAGERSTLPQDLTERLHNIRTTKQLEEIKREIYSILSDDAV